MSTNTLNVSLATTAQLLAFFNANTSGAAVKKFADRKTAERRVNALMAEMSQVDEVVEETASTIVTARDVGVTGFSVHGHRNCFHCGTYLKNGVGTHLQEVNGVEIQHDKFEFACLACGEEFGPAITKTARKNLDELTRPQMQASLKLDRTIQCVETKETWKNAFRMWKEHADWMTSAQVDRLTRVLYTAAKQPNPVAATVTINGRTFKLVNV
jgi:hypothetical protein